MTTQLENARKGLITDEMKEIGRQEEVAETRIRDAVAAGELVICGNRDRSPQKAVGIGGILPSRINASIGTSTDMCDQDLEVRKARAAEEEGADTLMELSAGGDLDAIRRGVLDGCRLPVGNVPLYQAFCEASRIWGDPDKMETEFLFDLIERQLADGISFMAIHCGINLFTLERLRRQGYRYGGLVSKGGTFLASWMENNNTENPLYDQFDRVFELMKKYDAVLSLGNGIRAGAIHDSHDRAQMAEMILNCELAERARQLGCQVMVEGPGHVPLDEIEGNIMLEKRMSGNAPYYVLGPIPCDSGAGYDHVTAAIGAAMSAWKGADLICYITPAEHLALPDEHDVREGVRVTRLAVHTGTVAKRPDLRENERRASTSRRDMRWEEHMRYLLFPQTAAAIRDNRAPARKETCSMCGDFCAMRKGAEQFGDSLDR